MAECVRSLKACLCDYWRTLAVNLLCSFLLVIYATFGATVFLYFEVPFSVNIKITELQDKTQCASFNIQQFLTTKHVELSLPLDALNFTNYTRKRRKRLGNGNQILERADETADIDMDVLGMARQVTKRCAIDAHTLDEKSVWNLKNAFLFSFGIMTTLGYGKIEPQTENGRIFTVVYGFVGVPFTVILLTNFMRYLLNLERTIRKHYYVRQQHKRRMKKEHEEAKRQFRSINIVGHNNTNDKSSHTADNDSNSSKALRIPSTKTNTIKDDNKFHAESMKKFSEKTDLAAIVASLEEFGQISMCTLICIVFVYMLCGGVLMWVMETPTTQSNANPTTRFLSGIYFAFIALIHIEYGNLVPGSSWWLPFVMSYVCLGLSISAIALSVGSAYVKRLYYYGRKIGNIASVKIRFGAKNLQVRELLTALGHNIGLEPTILFDLDLEKLVSDAIDVKEGRMERVPQTYMIVDGIWPPELVPLFIKDGGDFPLYVDAEEAQISERRGLGNLWSSFRNSLRTRADYSSCSGLSRRRHSSASLLPIPKGLLRQKLSWIRRDANNNDHELNNRVQPSSDNVGRRKVELRPLANIYHIEDHNPTISSLPSSRTQSPRQERRAPPPFLFHKPSVRFHDIIYNDWSQITDKPSQEKRHQANYYRYHHHYGYDNMNKNVENGCSPPPSTIIVNPMSRREIVRTIERESCNMQFFIPPKMSNMYAERFSKHSPSFENHDLSSCKKFDELKNIVPASSNTERIRHSEDAKLTITESFLNKNFLSDELEPEALSLWNNGKTNGDIPETTKTVEVEIKHN